MSYHINKTKKGTIYLMTPCIHKHVVNRRFFKRDNVFIADNPHRYNSSTFLLIEKLPKDQADMNPVPLCPPSDSGGKREQKCSMLQTEKYTGGMHFCKRKRLCTPLLEAGHSHRVRTACRPTRPRALWAGASVKSWCG